MYKIKELKDSTYIFMKSMCFFTLYLFYYKAKKHNKTFFLFYKKKETSENKDYFFTTFLRNVFLSFYIFNLWNTSQILALIQGFEKA